MTTRSIALVSVLALGAVVFVGGGLGLANKERAAGKLHPDEGISPIRLGESLDEINAAIGPGRPDRQGSPYRVYRVDGITIGVGFDKSYRAADIATDSKRVRVYGRRLGRPFHSFVKPLKAHRWDLVAYGRGCRGAIYDHGSRRRETVLVWKSGGVRWAQVVGRNRGWQVPC